MKVSLLDAEERDLPGRNFYYTGQLPLLSEPQSKPPLASEEWMWNTAGHIFSGYPPGLRFIRFEDIMQSDITGSATIRPIVRGSGQAASVEFDPYGEPAPTDCYNMKACGASVKITQK